MNDCKNKVALILNWPYYRAFARCGLTVIGDCTNIVFNFFNFSISGSLAPAKSNLGFLNLSCFTCPQKGHVLVIYELIKMYF